MRRLCRQCMNFAGVLVYLQDNNTSTALRDGAYSSQSLLSLRSQLLRIVLITIIVRIELPQATQDLLV